MESLKHLTIKGVFWSFTESFGRYFLRLCFTIVIARILDPSDYGILGYTLIFTGLGRILSEGGFGMALIQKKDANDADYSSVFYFNIFIALVLYSLFFVFADTIANYFDQPILEKVIKVTSLLIILNALGTIQNTFLYNSMNFKTLAQISFIATICGGGVGLFLAFRGFGVWALVFQTVSNQFVTSGLLWIKGTWRPKLLFDFKNLKGLFGYGSKMLIQGIIDTLFNNLYYPIIGKLYPVDQLGFYTRANQFSQLFVKHSTSSIGRVLFPAITKIQDDKASLIRNYERIITLLIFFFFPGSLILIYISEPFVEVFLTSKWLPAVLFMQLLFLEGFFFPIYMFNQNVITALGLSGLSLRIELSKKLLLLLILLITAPHGIDYMISGYLFSSLYSMIISTYYVYRRVRFSMKAILFTASSTLLLIILMLSMLFISEIFIEFGDYIRLFIIPPILLAFYLICSKYLRTKSYIIFSNTIIQYTPTSLKKFL